MPELLRRPLDTLDRALQRQQRREAVVPSAPVDLACAVTRQAVGSALAYLVAYAAAVGAGDGAVFAPVPGSLAVRADVCVGGDGCEDLFALGGGEEVAEAAEAVERPRAVSMGLGGFGRRCSVVRWGVVSPLVRVDAAAAALTSGP